MLKFWNQFQGSEILDILCLGTQISNSTLYGHLSLFISIQMKIDGKTLGNTCCICWNLEPTMICHCPGTNSMNSFFLRHLLGGLKKPENTDMVLKNTLKKVMKCGTAFGVPKLWYFVFVIASWEILHFHPGWFAKSLKTLSSSSSENLNKKVEILKPNLGFPKSLYFHKSVVIAFLWQTMWWSHAPSKIK